jgi:hypothetical protein
MRDGPSWSSTGTITSVLVQRVCGRNEHGAVVHVGPRNQENVRSWDSGGVGEEAADAGNVGFREECVLGVVDDIDDGLERGVDDVLALLGEFEPQAESQGCDDGEEAGSDAAPRRRPTRALALVALLAWNSCHFLSTRGGHRRAQREAY